jgi:hypothetical protein
MEVINTEAIMCLIYFFREETLSNKCPTIYTKRLSQPPTSPDKHPMVVLSGLVLVIGPKVWIFKGDKNL